MRVHGKYDILELKTNPTLIRYLYVCMVKIISYSVQLLETARNFFLQINRQTDN